MSERLEYPKNFPSKKSNLFNISNGHEFLIAPNNSVVDSHPGDLYWKCSCGEEFSEYGCKSVYQSLRDSYLKHIEEMSQKELANKVLDWEKILDEIDEYSCNAYRCRNSPVGIVKIYDSQPYCEAHINSFLKSGMKHMEVVWGSSYIEKNKISQLALNKSRSLA